MTNEIKEVRKLYIQIKRNRTIEENARLKEEFRDAFDRQDLDEIKMIRGWLRENEQEIHLAKEALKIYNEELKDLAD